MSTKAELERTVRDQAHRITALATDRDSLSKGNRQTGDLLQKKEEARAKLENEVEKLQADHTLLEKQYQVLESNEQTHRVTDQLFDLKSTALSCSSNALVELQDLVSAVANLKVANFGK